MKKNLLTLSIFLYSSGLCLAQSLHLSEVEKFIQDYFSVSQNKNRLYLIDSCVKNVLMWPESKAEMYGELIKYIPPDPLDSLIKISRVMSDSFSWNDIRLDSVQIISADVADTIIQKSTTLFVSIRRKFLCVKRDTVFPIRCRVKALSFPVFYEDRYCLIYESHISGISMGGSRVALYCKDFNDKWVLYETIYSTLY